MRRIKAAALIAPAAAIVVFAAGCAIPSAEATQLTSSVSNDCSSNMWPIQLRDSSSYIEVCTNGVYDLVTNTSDYAIVVTVTAPAVLAVYVPNFTEASEFGNLTAQLSGQVLVTAMTDWVVSRIYSDRMAGTSVVLPPGETATVAGLQKSTTIQPSVGYSTDVSVITNLLGDALLDLGPHLTSAQKSQAAHDTLVCAENAWKDASKVLRSSGGIGDKITLLMNVIQCSDAIADINTILIEEAEKNKAAVKGTDLKSDGAKLSGGSLLEKIRDGASELAPAVSLEFK